MTTARLPTDAMHPGFLWISAVALNTGSEVKVITLRGHEQRMAPSAPEKWLETSGTGRAVGLWRKSYIESGYMGTYRRYISVAMGKHPTKASRASRISLGREEFSASQDLNQTPYRSVYLAERYHLPLEIKLLISSSKSLTVHLSPGLGCCLGGQG